MVVYLDGLGFGLFVRVDGIEPDSEIYRQREDGNQDEFGPDAHGNPGRRWGQCWDVIRNLA